jgi:hypothetical protein
MMLQITIPLTLSAQALIFPRFHGHNIDINEIKNTTQPNNSNAMWAEPLPVMT